MTETGSVFTHHSQEHSLSFSPRFCKFECNTTWFSQSEVALHSNPVKYRNTWRTRQTMSLRMVGEYGPWTRNS